MSAIALKIDYRCQDYERKRKSLLCTHAMTAAEPQAPVICCKDLNRRKVRVCDDVLEQTIKEAEGRPC